jgi:hypothetical protein
MSAAPESTREIVRSLTEKIRRWERDHRGPAEIVSSGLPALDRLLPDGGFCRGTLVEWLAAGAEKVSGTKSRGRIDERVSKHDLVPDTFSGSGAATLALAIAARACRESGALVVVDRPRMFYPPAAAGFEVDWNWLVVGRPGNDRDEAWALDQVLRCPGVGSVLAWPRKLNERRFRQMQLAAEAGGTLGFFVRSDRARSEPSWAEMRLLVTGQRSEVGDRRSEVGGRRSRERNSPDFSEIMAASGLAATHRAANVGGRPSEVGIASRRWLQIELLRSRGGGEGGKIEIELDEATGALYEPRHVDLASQLAAPAAPGRSTGAFRSPGRAV